MLARARLHHELKLTSSVLLAWRNHVLRECAARSTLLSLEPASSRITYVRALATWAKAAELVSVHQSQLQSADRWRSERRLARTFQRMRSIVPRRTSLSMRMLVEDAGRRLAEAQRLDESLFAAGRAHRRRDHREVGYNDHDRV